MPVLQPLPPLLLPYLRPPLFSLTVLTSTLGASTNWLVLRFLYATLARQQRDFQTNPEFGESDATSPICPNEGPTRVILVSWLRNSSWWIDSGRKLGLDCSNLKIVDGFSNKLGLDSTRSDAIDIVENTILQAIASSACESPFIENDATRNSTVLILDGVDLLLAATGLSGISVQNMIFGLREHVYSTILTAHADGPLMDSPATPLEFCHVTFLMGLVHQAALVISVRELDTGTAKDVSGVVRIAKGAASWNTETTEDNWNGREFLYLVGGDGRVKIFERGS